MRYLTILSLTLAICFGAQALALRAAGGRTLKSESNFFSSLGRIQAGAHSRQNIMVLGSSITGRLPDSAQGFSGISNMGCDGGNGIDSLRAMDQGILPSAPWIIIEANTLNLSFKEKPTEVSVAMRSPWFKLGIKHPSVSAYARPSAFFYSKLLARKIGSFSTADAARGFGIGSLPSLPAPAIVDDLAPVENHLIAEISSIIERLQRGGSNVVFVWFPPARAESTPPPWILALVRKSHSYWWDLAQNIPSNEVTLTDGVHMDATSATRTTGELLRAVNELSIR
jgi:hypothetical protein